MRDAQIVFTKQNTAELLERPFAEPGGDQVVVETAISTISCGTERANITGDPNVSGNGPAAVNFPRSSGYSSAGTVLKTGSKVKSVKPGDRVVVYWGNHRKYNTVHENQVVKIEDEGISFQEAALSFIASFPLAAIRKTRLEIGESALVMGLGILGQLAVRLLKAAGAVPVLAADLVLSRRLEALQGGADEAFDPMEANFAEKVRKRSGGVNAAIEVTGVGAGLDSALDCMAKFGRVALLGCTRNPDFTIDYYRKVHFPGIQLIGAHTLARPETESHPGYFTHRDDIKAILRLLTGKRMKLEDLVKETHDPDECQAVYTRLIEDRNFPVAVQFDWRNLK